MEQIELIALALKREGVEKFPPIKHGAYFTDNPKTEVWGLNPVLAEAVKGLAAKQEIEEGEVVRSAIRSHFHLPDEAGETKVMFKQRATGDFHLILDRDDTLTDVLKAVATARGNTNHLAVLHECLTAYVELETVPTEAS